MSVKTSTKDVGMKATLLAQCVRAVNNMTEFDDMDGDWLIIKEKVYVKVHEFMEDLRKEEK